MALSLGDATLQFLANTQSLDQAFDRVKADAATKLQPVQQQVSLLGTNLTATGAKATVSAQSFAQAGDKIATTIKKSTVTVDALRAATAALPQEVQELQETLLSVADGTVGAY